MTPEQRRAVVAEAMAWVGTPYHHHARIKGVGVDCAQLICAVFEACGLTPHVDTGHYPVCWHLHRGAELFEQALARYCRRLHDAPAAPGDVAVYRYGRCYSHGALVVDGGLQVHAYIGRGVILSAPNEEPLDGRPVRYWTLQ